MERIQLTLKERLFLQNQYLILEKLYPAGGYAEKRAIVENGYTYHYDDLFNSISDKELSIEDCKFVLDVLEMYRGIIFSNRKLKDSALPDVSFPGFDGNNETELMAYARFFMIDLDRYDEIKEGSGNDFNSHSQMRPRYELMLEKWLAINNEHRYAMSKTALEDLLNTY